MNIAHGRFFGLIRISSLAGLVGIVALLMASLVNEYQEAERHARSEAENLSRVLEEHTLAIVQKIDLALRDMQRHVRPADMRLVPGEGGMRAGELHALLKSYLEGVPEVSLLHLIDAKGEHLHSSLATLPRVNLADRPYFQRQRDNPAAALVISSPIVSRVTGNWTLILSRRLNFEDGSFAGTVQASLDMKYFQQLYRSLNLGAHGAVLLRDGELRLAARFPPSENDMGKSMPDHPAAAFLNEGIKYGTYHVKSPLDGVERVYSFRQVGSLPLVVLAGLAKDDYLAEWRRHVWQSGISVAVLILVVIGFGVRQRQAEEALRERENKYKILFESANDGIFLQDATGFVDCNQRGADMYGLAKSDVIGHSPAEFCPERQPDGRLSAEVATEKVQAALGGEPQFFEWRPLRADKTAFDAEISLNRIEFGDSVYLQAIVRDVTERKRVEEALRESEERWKFALDGSDEGVWDWNYQTGAAVFSRRWKEMLGFAENEIENNADEWVKRVHPDDMPSVMAALQAHIEGKTPSAVVEFRMSCKDGGWKWILGRGMVVNRDADGKALRLVGTNADITERKLAEAQIRELNETLEQRVAEETAKNREKDHLMMQQSRLAAMGEMVGNIAHQWRQPLSALSLLLQNIRLDYADGMLNQDEVEDYTNTGTHLIQKMSVTIDDFRNFFKPNKDKRSFCPAVAVEETLKLVSHSFKNNNIEVAFEKCAEPCDVIGYPNEFSQVVLNALSNAKDVIIEKQIPGKVLIRVEKGADMATITIRDNGGGIPEEILPKIFDPYFTTKEKGTGIGLYMSKMIMDNMRGNIIIRNVDDGTEVLLTIPLNEN